MIHDFTITDMTPRLGYPSYWDAVWNCRVYCVGHKVYDARGRRVLFVQWCDDETGEVVRLQRNPTDDGCVIDPITQQVVVVRERHPAPLRVVEMKPGEKYYE